MKKIAPITYAYDFQGHRIEVTRHHVGESYPRNGNVGNPTEYFTWASTLDGEHVYGYAATRASAYEYARARALDIRYRNDEGAARRSENVRNFRVVQLEMQANYKGKVRS